MKLAEGRRDRGGPPHDASGVATAIADSMTFEYPSKLAIWC